ncbi:hypothetical protein T439DRAFT_383972 [Meredithblackwellia eburnea MCA 4105]
MVDIPVELKQLIIKFVVQEPSHLTKLGLDDIDGSESESLAESDKRRGGVLVDRDCFVSTASSYSQHRKQVRKYLTNIALVSKEFRDIAHNFLFNQLDLTRCSTPQLVHFTFNLLPRCAQLIQSIAISISHPVDDKHFITAQLSRQSIQHSFNSDYESGDTHTPLGSSSRHALLTRILLSLPSLRSLSIDTPTPRSSSLDNACIREILNVIGPNIELLKIRGCQLAPLEGESAHPTVHSALRDIIPLCPNLRQLSTLIGGSFGNKPVSPFNYSFFSTLEKLETLELDSFGLRLDLGLAGCIPSRLVHLALRSFNPIPLHQFVSLIKSLPSLETLDMYESKIVLRPVGSSRGGEAGDIFQPLPLPNLTTLVLGNVYEWQSLAWFNVAPLLSTLVITSPALINLTAWIAMLDMNRDSLRRVYVYLDGKEGGPFLPSHLNRMMEWALKNNVQCKICR